MSVIVTKGGNGLLGGLGALATIGGALTGQPWLTAAGTGLGALGSAMNGDAQSTATLANTIGDLLNSWINPAGKNIAKSPYQATVDDLAGMYNMQNSSNPYQAALTGRYKANPWQNTSAGAWGW